MRVILDGFDGSFLPILQSFKAVMPSLRITGIEELGDSVNGRTSSTENGDAINVSELFARQYERDELLSDGTLFLQANSSISIKIGSLLCSKLLIYSET